MCWSVYLGGPGVSGDCLWVIGCSFAVDFPLNNIKAALSDSFTKGFALLAMPLFILTGDLLNRSGIARRLSDLPMRVWVGSVADWPWLH